MGQITKIAVTRLVLLLLGCQQKTDNSLESAKPEMVTETSMPDAAAPLEVSASVQACASAMLNTKIKFKEWEAGLNANCGSLSDEEQKLASKKATELSGEYTTNDITLPRINFNQLPADAISEFKEGSLPYRVRPLSEEEEWLALQGNYQAQRNYAYSLSGKNPIAACAWRIVIIELGHKRVDTTDTGNLKVYCGKLDTIELTAAENQAKQLLQLISRNSLQIGGTPNDPFIMQRLLASGGTLSLSKKKLIGLM